MGETGENVAERLGVSSRGPGRVRASQPAQRSRARSRRAATTSRSCRSPSASAKASRSSCEATSIRGRKPLSKALARLEPAFREGGSVTAGNSSGINDGASAVLVVESARARALGLTPMARVVATAVAGVDPALMGLGPIPATRKALERAGLSIGDLDLIELNEAFASQSVACIRELGLDPDRVNVDGGAIALGHPLGASGGRLVTTLVHSLRRTGGRYGLATMCIGVGQGIAMVIERF